MSKSRSYTFTLNNYTKEDELFLQETLDAGYLVYGREVGESGTPHLQGYIHFDNPRSFKSVAKLRKWHIEQAKADVLRNAEYCKKGDNYFEKGKRPLTAKEKGISERDRYKRAYDSAVAGNFDDIDPDIHLRHYSTLKRIRMDHIKPTDMDTMPLCIYIWGETGTGKSRLAKEICGDNVYKKEPLTKWWTGYDHQESVWIDEAEPMSHELQSMYKRLCDYYTLPVETKGGNMIIRPRMVIFTSNYSPERVFQGAFEPMARRLKIYNLTHENASQIQEDVSTLSKGSRPQDGSQDTSSHEGSYDALSGTCESAQ